MGATELQFIFSLFSFVGVVGILFYIILEKAKQDEKNEQIERLEAKLASLRDYVYEYEHRMDEQKEPSKDAIKEKIITLYDSGKDLSYIEDTLAIPRAKIEMVLKFHNLQKSDNWRKSVDESL